jgi:hypothetical protein
VLYGKGESDGPSNLYGLDDQYGKGVGTTGGKGGKDSDDQGLFSGYISNLVNTTKNDLSSTVSQVTGYIQGAPATSLHRPTGDSSDKISKTISKNIYNKTN